MSVLNSEAFHEGIPEPLQIFDLPKTNCAVSDVLYEEIRPVSQVTDSSLRVLITIIIVFSAHKYFIDFF